MRAGSDQRPKFKQREENHDGRTIALLVFCTVSMFGSLFAGGFATVSFLMGNDRPDYVSTADLAQIADSDRIVLDTSPATTKPGSVDSLRNRSGGCGNQAGSRSDNQQLTPGLKTVPMDVTQVKILAC